MKMIDNNDGGDVAQEVRCWIQSQCRPHVIVLCKDG
jgi:hypothetical protein